jgi:hypothetical protein
MFSENLELLKEYYEKVFHCSLHEKHLKESPKRIGSIISYDYEDDNPRLKYFQIIENPDIFEKIFDVDENVSVYQEKDGDDVMLYFISKNFENVVGHIFFEEISLNGKNGAFIASIYNHKMFSGLCEKIYFEHILKNYDFIMSGDSQTKRGERFWEKIAIYATNKGKFLYIYDGNSINELKDVKEMKNFYGEEFEKSKFRFIISNNKIETDK